MPEFSGTPSIYIRFATLWTPVSAARNRRGLSDSGCRTTVTGVSESDDVRREAAELLAIHLESVRTGDLEATSAQGRRMLRRIEGAVTALAPDVEHTSDSLD